MDIKGSAAERRQRLELRAVFEEAFERIDPLLELWRSPGSQASTVLVFHMLRESYPQLSVAEIHMLVGAAHRLHRSRKLSGVPARGPAPRTREVA